MLRFCFGIAFVLTFQIVYCQQKIEVKEMKGGEINRNKIVNNNKTIVYNKIDNSNKEKILLVSKFIDTNKLINIHFASNIISIPKTVLKNGFTPVKVNGNNVFSIRLVGKQLLINCVLFDFDSKYSAKVKNNILLKSEEYEQYASDKYLEVINKNNIPVLQITLNKDSNSIHIYGMTFEENSIFVFGQNGIQTLSYAKPFLLMNEAERKRVVYESINFARSLIIPMN